MTSAARPPILQLQNISKTFPGVQALDRVCLELHAGEVHVLLGENGAGKSTLVKILAGVFVPDPGGQILLDGRPVVLVSPQESHQLGISVIHQELSLVPGLSAAANMMLGREPVRALGRIDHGAMKQQAQEILQRLGVSFDLELAVERLSVAQQQTVEIASALVGDCRVLTLDEPTSALAEHEVEKLGEVLQRLKERGVAILYISHRFEEIFRFGDRVTVLRDGQAVKTGRIRDFSRDELVRSMVGREVVDTFPQRTRPPGEVLLQVEDLSSPAGVRGVSFTVRSGEVVSLAGLLGSGRTAVARAIFGADPRATGRVWLGGRPVPLGSVGKAISLGLALAPEDRKNQGLVLSMDVRDNICLAGLSRFQGRTGRLRRDRQQRRVWKLMRRLQIKASSPHQRVGTLSGGNQQKVVLAKWLNTEARCFLFDEPTRGIDVGARQGIYQFMNRLASSGAAILMISSELPEVLGMSDRILIMSQGRIVGELQRGASADQIMHLATEGQ